MPLLCDGLAYNPGMAKARAKAGGKRRAQKPRKTRATLPVRARAPNRAAPVTATRTAWAGVSDDAVRKATGKGWKDWVALLDKKGARKLDHRAIVALVSAAGAGPWWQQMVTVGYEQARGLRAKHQKADGFAVSASRTIAAPASRVFRACVDAKERARWLPDALEITTQSEPRTVRARWPDDTRLSIGISPKGDRTQITVQHEKLPDEAAAAEMKVYWARRIDALRADLEG